jgi:hypothetical protein
MFSIGIPKFTKSGIFGLETNHLATLSILIFRPDLCLPAKPGQCPRATFREAEKNSDIFKIN